MKRLKFKTILLLILFTMIVFGVPSDKGFVGDNFKVPGNISVSDNTAGKILVANGSYYIPKAISGDGTIDANGVLTLSAALADSAASTKKVLTNVSSLFSGAANDQTWIYSYYDGYNVHLAALEDNGGTETTKYLASKQDVLNGDVGQSLWFDGVDDNIDCGDSDDFTLPDSSLTIYARFLVHDLSVSVNVVCSKILNASTCEYLMYVGDDGALHTILYDSGGTANTSNFKTSTGIIQENKIYDVVFVYDGNNSKYYINGVAFTATEIVGGTGFSVFTNTAAALQLGARIINSNYAAITLYGVRFFNLALDPTDEEDLAIINGGAVPYKYQGASNDELVTNGDVEAGLPSVNGVTINAARGTVAQSSAYASGGTYSCEYTGDGTVGNKSVYWTNYDMDLIPGKQYGVIADVYIPVGNTVVDNLKLSYSSNGTSESTTTQGSWVTLMAVFIATETISDNISIKDYSTDSTTEKFYVDNISLTQIGCVADYSPEGIGHNQWTEVSGNKLHGTISGARPVNLPVNHSEIYNLTVTGETTFTLPSGYMIDYIIAKETAGDTITALDLGFTDGGGEIVAAADFTGSDEKSLTVLQRIDDFDAEDTVYISATAWNSASLDVVVRMKRMVIN